MQPSWVCEITTKISLVYQRGPGVISSDQHKDKCEYNHCDNWYYEMVHGVSSKIFS